jgi:hypothetical protein
MAVRFMIKKIIYFLCTFLIFISSMVIADEMHEPEIVKINGISMYKSVADRIFANIKNNDQAIEANVNTQEAIIHDNDLMDIITELYFKAMSNKDNHVIVLEITRSEEKEIVIYVNKEKKLIDTIIIKNCETDDC